MNLRLFAVSVHSASCLRKISAARGGGPQPRGAIRKSTPTAFLLLATAYCGWIALPPAAAQTSPEKPVAVVGEEKLYEKDFMPQIESKLYKIRQQEYELKRRSLEDAIGKKLLLAEAQKQGISEAELLRKEADFKVGEPSDEDVEQQFVAQMFRGGGQITESKDDIREQLKKEAVQQARDAYFLALRQKAGVKIFLLPPQHAVDYDPARVRGNPDAPITMVEFSDFQCPYCEQAYLMMKSLLQKYDGKLKLAYRDLPLQEVQSKIHGAAEASRCAGEQGKFWEYHDLLFENQDAYGEAAFRDFAASLKLNTDQFDSCLESGKYVTQIKQDFQEALRLGATGTPAIFINGVFVNGARPQPEFEEIIEAFLATMN
jgi:protein-disulfide isomerase